MKILLCALLLASSYGQAAVGSWSTSGPEGVQGAAIAVSPAAPDVVLVAAAGGIYKSINAGNSWARLSNNIGYVNNVWAHPTLASTYLALTNRLYRSTNAGSSWSVVGTGLPTASTSFLSTLAVDATAPSNVFVTDILSGVYRSTNGGVNFTPIAIAGIAPDTNYDAITVDPYVNSRVMVSVCSNSTPGQAGLYRSTDGGLSFVPVPSYPNCTYARFVFSGNTSGLVFSDFLKSTDGGATWIASGAPGTVIASRNTTAELYSFSGTVFSKSTDNGTTWAPFVTGATDNGTDHTSVARLEFKPGSAPLVSYLLSSAGSFFKATGAGSFTASNTGLIASNIRAVAVHPTNSSILLAGWGDVGNLTSPAMFRSTNRGSTWVRANTGLALDEVRDIEIDQNTTASAATTVVYAAGWDRAPFQTPPTLYRASIAKSSDGGQTWSHAPNANFAGFGTAGVISMGRARNIAIDLRSQIGGAGPSQKVYFTARGSVRCPTTGAGPVAQTLVAPRMWKTIDAGVNWTSIDTFPTGTCTPGDPTSPSPVVKDVVIDPSNSNILYVGSFLSGYDPTLPAPTVQTGIFKSIDGGASWTQSSNGLPRIGGAGTSHRDVLALVIDPSNPLILYAAVNPTTGVGPGRIYKTVDGGANWSVASTGVSGQDIRALIIDPTDSTKVYAASGGSAGGPGGVYYSANSGVTWNSTSIALPATSATALDLDRTGVDPILYAGTNAGLWDITQVPDLDFDGPSNLLEGSSPFAGDGNEDGAQDSAQANVASIAGLLDNGITRVISSTADVTISVTGVPAGSCQQVNDASADYADRIGPENAGYTYPFGVVRFELLNCTRAFITVRYHNRSFNPLFRFRNFGPEILGNLNSVQWREVTTAGYSGNAWTFLLDDNAPGDNRDEASRILFIGGPATEQMLKDGFE